MPHLSIHLEDWQEAALAELARARGMDVETMAESLLSERLVERMRTAFDDLPCDPFPRVFPGPDTIEARLKRLFEE